MGIKGDLGLPGDPGPVGPRGPPGAKGAKGEPGKSISTPSLLHRPVETTVNKSQTAILKCTADGNPSPQVTWSKVGRHVVESGGALIVKNVRPGDEGVYRCRAENLLGSVNASVKLTVRCRLTCYFFLYSKVATGARTIRGAKWIAVKEKDLFGVFLSLAHLSPLLIRLD